MKIFKLAIKVILGLAFAVGLLSVFMAILSRFVKRPANLGVDEWEVGGHVPIHPTACRRKVQIPVHQINPLAYTTTPAEAQAKLVGIIRSMERAEIIHEEPGYIYAEFRTKGMGYVDDVEFAHRPGNTGYSLPVKRQVALFRLGRQPQAHGSNPHSFFRNNSK